MVHNDIFDAAYERNMIILMGLGSGLVGLDRFLVAPLFPFMARDLHLGYQQLGNVMGALALGWAVFSIAIGRVSDRIGRRSVLVVSIVAFSLLSGLSGLATGYAMLIAIRVLMGTTEGSFIPVSVAAIAEASRPDRVGFNLGLATSMFALIGLGFGPIIATGLLNVVPSWRWVFLIAAIPGLVTGVLIALAVRDRPASSRAHEAASHSWLDVIRHRNVILCVLGLFCTMSGVFVMSAMVPTYLIDYLHLSTGQMGFVTSAIGFGGFVGQFTVCFLSDRLGRRTMAVVSFALALVFLFLFSRTGAEPPVLFALLFVSTLFGFGLLSLLTGPVPTEAVGTAMTGTAVGLVSGTAEIFGGAIAPAVAGFIAQHYGIQHIFTLAFVGLLLGILVAAMLTETAPRKRATRTAIGLRDAA